MSKLIRYALAGSMALGLSASTALADDKPKAEVMHWLTSGGEAEAVEVFANQYEKAGGVWIDNAVAGGNNARAAAINRMVGGSPPTAAQFNTGKQFSDLVEQGLLRDMEGIAKEQGWRDFMPPSFVEASTREGKFYAVPFDVHGQNWIFYSKKVFEDSGIESAPQSFDELFSALDKIKEKGYLPLVVGEKTWQERLFFYNVFLGKGGKSLYLKVFRDKDEKALGSAEFLDVMKTFDKFRSYVVPGTSGKNWNDATAKVITDKAGMQVMGDWAKGDFINAGEKAGQDFGCVLMPNSQTLMVGGDVFIFPKTGDTQQQEAQNLLAKTVLEPETQVAFSKKKGSLPIRADVDMSGLDECATSGLKKLRARDTAPTTDFLISPSLNGRIGDIITEFWHDNSVTPQQAAADMKDAILND